MNKRISYAAAAAARATDVLAGDSTAARLLTEARTRLAESSYRIRLNTSDIATLGAVAVCGGDKPEHTALAVISIRSALNEIQRCT